MLSKRLEDEEVQFVSKWQRNITMFELKMSGKLYRNWVLSHHRNHSIILVRPLKTPGLGSSIFRRTFWLEAAIGFIFFFLVFGVFMLETECPGSQEENCPGLKVYLFMYLCVYFYI